MTMTVLVNAGPWLALPPTGYGGLENVVATLVHELRRRGVRVALATVADSKADCDESLAVFPSGQFRHLQQPYNTVSGVSAAHLQAVVRRLQAHDDIDLVHDHVEVTGPAVLSAMGPCGPPVLHTLHWDLTKHPDFYGRFSGGARVWVNGVSADHLRHAPAALRAHALGHVYHGTPQAARPLSVVPASGRERHLVVLARITPCKGTHIAARLAHQLKTPVVLAGPVGPYPDAASLAGASEAALLNPDVRYWHDEVSPYVDGDLVRWAGTLSGRDRDELVASARATLCPIQWAEPGGLALVASARHTGDCLRPRLRA
ncbi:glycosyltransferase [Streptomyces sp. UNOC14_S4]|uniref:glycosyltransferase n=1 Tax=Streptomyces sp. UNOC14_S4 TaxID=2872340 RepID=UPI001E2A4D42|nr:glycosyltransferase [Streptomyces sp. UNOC14_S4]MCC3767922.1 glycosyltransferase [Streptomyces sp. UNOC14_S4]